MTGYHDKKGDAFEEWILDILSRYVRYIDLTNKTAHYDLEFVHLPNIFLIECKCYNLTHKKGSRKMGEMSFQRTQIDALKNMMNKSKKIVYICGIMLNDNDIYPVVIPFNKILDYADKMNGMKYVTIQMTRLLTEKPFRQWIAETFNTDPGKVSYPPFKIEEKE